MNITKLGTEDLKKKIASGKYEGQELEDMKAALLKREEKAKKSNKAEISSTPAVVEEKAPVVEQAEEAAPVPAAKPKKDRKPKVDKTEPTSDAPADPAVPAPAERPGSRREYLRSIITPTDDSRTAAVTWSEASKLVLEKFPNSERKQPLYTSEWDYMIKKLIGEGVIDSAKVAVHTPAIPTPPVAEASAE